VKKLPNRVTPGACIGDYDVCFNQVWPRTQSIIFKNTRNYRAKQSVHLREPVNAKKLHFAVDSDRNQKAPDFEKMPVRKPMVNLPSYNEQDSEEFEQRKLDEYLYLNFRPPSMMKRSRIR
jgi:hypothetical protein